MRGLDALFYAGIYNYGSARDTAGRGGHISAWLARFPTWDLARREASAGHMAINLITTVAPASAGAVEELLSGLADVESVADLGSTPLFLAATKNYADDRTVQLLLSRGADPNKPFRARTLKWRAILAFARLAVRFGNVSPLLTELAWRHGATPLHAAAARGKVETVQLLVEARAVVSRNAQGLTPLELAQRLLGSVPEVFVDAFKGKGAPNIRVSA